MLCKVLNLSCACPCRVHLQVSASFASVLQDMGFSVNSMGGETRLDLATYNFTGTHMVLILYASSRGYGVDCLSSAILLVPQQPA